MDNDAINIPEVSIIIPAYNAEAFIAETIESVKAQTWPNKQLIIVNDGSTDNTFNVANTYQYNWVTVINSGNKGAAAARNIGLEYATGKYIQFLDADDLLSPDKISVQIQLLENNPDKIAVSNTVHFENGQDYIASVLTPSKSKFLVDDDDPIHFLIGILGGYSENTTMVAVHAWLTPKSIIDEAGKWNESLTVDDDGEFFARVILASKGVLHSGGLCYYRKYKNGKNLSAQVSSENLLSRLHATELKKQHLLAVTNVFEVQTSTYKILMLLAVNSYLKYPEIYRKAIAALPPIKMNYRPPLGGPAAIALGAVFGWRFVRILQHLKTKLVVL